MLQLIFLFQLIFVFPLFLGMVIKYMLTRAIMDANEFETKEKQKETEIKN